MWAETFSSNLNDYQKWNKSEKKKELGGKNSTDKSDSSENEIDRK